MAMRELAKMNLELVRNLTIDEPALSEAFHTSNRSSSLYYKCHTFKVHTYKSPQWCEVCHQFLWGLSDQGMRCQTCGKDIHRHCYTEAMEEGCVPTKDMVKQVFGVDLTTIAKMDGSNIPNVVKECIEAIEARGEKVDFSQYMDLNIITSVLKLFLRELPVPVISHDAYSEIMKATAYIQNSHGMDTDWEVLASSLKFLPKAHYHLLRHLSCHLHKVEEASALNKMTANNLATVFAPTLMRSPASEDPALVKDFTLQRFFVECLITKAPVLFK